MNHEPECPATAPGAPQSDECEPCRIAGSAYKRARLDAATAVGNLGCRCHDDDHGCLVLLDDALNAASSGDAA